MSQTVDTPTSAPPVPRDVSLRPIDAARSPLVHQLGTGLGDASGVALNDKIYVSAQNDGICRLPLAGGVKEQLTASAASGMALDAGYQSGTPALYYSDFWAGSVRSVPLAEGVRPAAIVGLNGPCGLALSDNGGHMAVCTVDGDLFYADLAQDDPGAPLASNLGTHNLGVALDQGNAPRNAYVCSRYGGQLWQVALDGSGRTLLAVGMDSPCSVAVYSDGVRPPSAYVACENGDLWCVPLGNLQPLRMEQKQHLVAFNLGTARAVELDAEGNAYVANAEGLLLQIKDAVSSGDGPDPSGAPSKPVITTPHSEAITGVRPDFTGIVPGSLAAGTTVRAEEGATTIARDVPVDAATGQWIFDRTLTAGPWTVGEHTVSVVAEYGGKTSDPATVTFSVIDPRQPVITSPRNESTTGLTPYFEGIVPRPVEAGTYVRATDSVGNETIADRVLVDPATGAWNFVRDFAGTWAVGPHTVTVTAVDGVNVSAPATVEFTVDGLDQPVILTPRNEATTGLTPYFTGKVPGRMPAGTTVRAVENGTVIAEGMPVDPVSGAWGFVRRAEAGAWTPGVKTVTVTAVYGGASSPPATVVFTVDRVQQLVILTPRNEATTGLTPYFTGNVPTGMPAGMTVRAVENGTVIAEGVRVDPVSGAWGFVRRIEAGAWTPGVKTVTVTAVYDGVSIQPATVVFTVGG